MRKHRAHEFSQGQNALFTPFIFGVQTSESNLSSVAFCMKHTFLIRDSRTIFLHFLSVMNVNHDSRTLSFIKLNLVTQFHFQFFYCLFHMPVSSFSNICSLVEHFWGFVYLLSIYASDVWALKNPVFGGWLTTVYPTNILQLQHSLHILYLLCNVGKWRLVF